MKPPCRASPLQDARPCRIRGRRNKGNCRPRLSPVIGTSSRCMQVRLEPVRSAEPPISSGRTGRERIQRHPATPCASRLLDAGLRSICRDCRVGNRRPVGRQFAGDAPFELCREFGKLLASTRLDPRLPVFASLPRRRVRRASHADRIGLGNFGERRLRPSRVRRAAAAISSSPSGAPCVDSRCPACSARRNR